MIIYKIYNVYNIIYTYIFKCLPHVSSKGYFLNLYLLVLKEIHFPTKYGFAVPKLY